MYGESLVLVLHVATPLALSTKRGRLATGTLVAGCAQSRAGPGVSICAEGCEAVSQPLSLKRRRGPGLDAI